VQRSALFERQKKSNREPFQTRFDSPCVPVVTTMHGDGQHVDNGKVDATGERQDKEGKEG